MDDFFRRQAATAAPMSDRELADAARYLERRRGDIACEPGRGIYEADYRTGAIQTEDVSDAKLARRLLGEVQRQRATERLPRALAAITPDQRRKVGLWLLGLAHDREVDRGQIEEDSGFDLVGALAALGEELRTAQRGAAT